jgi:hypothetical protein
MSLVPAGAPDVNGPPQIRAAAGPECRDLVTVTAGGNDLQFAGAMLYAAWSRFQSGSPMVPMLSRRCRRHRPAVFRFADVAHHQVRESRSYPAVLSSSAERALPGYAAAKPHPCEVLHAETHGDGRGPFCAQVIEVFAAAHVGGGLIHPGALMRCSGSEPFEWCPEMAARRAFSPAAAPFLAHSTVGLLVLS